MRNPPISPRDELNNGIASTYFQAIVEGRVKCVSASKLKRGKPKFEFVGNFMMIALKLFSDLSVNKDLGVNDFKVLFWILGSVGFDNKIILNQSKISKDIGINARYVGSAVNKMIGMDMIIVLKKHGVLREIILNPRVCFAGSATAHQKAVRKYTQPPKLKQVKLKVVK
jgi:hypothetical protein